MKRRTKIWLIVAAALILAGGILFTGVMTSMNWNFRKLTTIQHETNTFVVTDAFTNISLADNTADIEFVPSVDGTVSVTCYDDVNILHIVSVEENTLVIRYEDTRKWYQYIGINWDSAKITVCLPAGAYGALKVEATTGDVKIPADFSFASVDVSVSSGNVSCTASVTETMKVRTSTGDIRVSDVSVGALELSVSTGKVLVSSVTCAEDIRMGVSTGKTTLSDVTCRNLTSVGTTGSIALTNVIAAETFSIKRSTGDVRFEACDAANLTITTSTGNIGGTLLSEKVFIANTNTGRVDTPDTYTGGKCECVTDTGDVRFSIL